jgi:hypothetical protein
MSFKNCRWAESTAISSVAAKSHRTANVQLETAFQKLANNLQRSATQSMRILLFQEVKNTLNNLQDNFTFLTKFCCNLKKSDGSGCMTSNKKNVRKFSLVPRQLNSSVWTSPSNNSSSCSQNVPLITLSSQTAAKLKDLILEGDSLEVSLDETIHIGRILQVLKFFPK